VAIATYFLMSVYFLTPNVGSAGDAFTDGDGDDMSLALGRSIVDQVSVAVLSALPML
jgi:hypothetical protein